MPGAPGGEHNRSVSALGVACAGGETTDGSKGKLGVPGTTETLRGWSSVPRRRASVDVMGWDPVKAVGRHGQREWRCRGPEGAHCLVTPAEDRWQVSPPPEQWLAEGQ